MNDDEIIKLNESIPIYIINNYKVLIIAESTDIITIMADRCDDIMGDLKFMLKKRIKIIQVTDDGMAEFNRIYALVKSDRDFSEQFLSEIHNCTYQFKFKCPLNWSFLDKTENKLIKYCKECKKSVYFAKNERELDEHISNNRCVAYKSKSSDGGMEYFLGEMTR